MHRYAYNCAEASESLYIASTVPIISPQPDKAQVISVQYKHTPSRVPAPHTQGSCPLQSPCGLMLNFIASFNLNVE